MEQKNTRSNFSNSVGFIMAAAGSAVGLGNIWRFPYLAAKDGGGVFILCYIILALTFGFAQLTTEVAIGRKTAQSPLTAYGKLHKNWGFLGNPRLLGSHLDSPLLLLDWRLGVQVSVQLCHGKGLCIGGRRILYRFYF